jgi:phospholipid transport system substrate-binding protein
VIVTSLLALASAGHADEASPTAIVQRLNDALLAALKGGKSLGYQGRFARLQPVMSETFDLGFMAEKSLGRNWQKLSPADQARWRDLFAEFTVANYAANFDRFTGQRFESLGEEPSANGTMLVKTKVVSPGADDVVLTYRLQKTDGRWRIVDVYLKGTVSELALRRADYTSLLEREGFAALTKVMRSTIDDLAAGRVQRDRS